MKRRKQQRITVRRERKTNDDREKKSMRIRVWREERQSMMKRRNQPRIRLRRGRKTNDDEEKKSTED